jgi:hypothetical protein
MLVQLATAHKVCKLTLCRARSTTCGLVIMPLTHASGRDFRSVWRRHSPHLCSVGACLIVKLLGTGCVLIMDVGTHELKQSCTNYQCGDDTIP